MSNKTFIPAFRAKVGDWQYYICTMKYAEVARQVQFAYELGGNVELGTMIQRGISERTKEITEYLLQSGHRFLGSLIIAAWGGAPDYQAIGMSDPDGLLTGIDQSFGVLTFDGTQQYFALDGQHRLKAIKDAIKQKPELGLEDICVLLVSHFDTEEGRLKTRRLFTNINRNAKITSAAENIALDEDYGISIITRRLLEAHDFLKQPGIVKVFQRTGDQGELALASGSVPKGDAKAFTTITVLHEWLKDLAFHLPKEISDKGARPTDPDLENAYEVIAKRVDELLDSCGDLKAKLKEAVSARDVRAPKDKEPEGHAFMRPVVQRAVARTIRQIIDQQTLTWEEALSRLSKLDWHIGKAPWIAVFAEQSNGTSGKMLGGKENTNLLSDLIRCHIAPQSKQAIKKARRDYKDIRGQAYPFTDEQLFEYLGAEEAQQPTEIESV
jgi:DNA sulfur modification protein DndB